MPKKYTGPERRSSRAGSESRRKYDWYPSRGRGIDMLGNYRVDSEAGNGYLFEIKEETTKLPERRVGGAGRRKSDLTRALKIGEPVVLDVSKTPKSAFSGKVKKLARKAGKLGLAISAASSIYDMVNRNKQ